MSSIWGTCQGAEKTIWYWKQWGVPLALDLEGVSFFNVKVNGALANSLFAVSAPAPQFQAIIDSFMGNVSNSFESFKGAGAYGFYQDAEGYYSRAEICRK